MASNATVSLPLVVGLGHTGLSLARFLAARGVPFAVADSRLQPPHLELLRAELGDHIPVHLGPFNEAVFCAASELLVSPGVSLDEPAIVAARARGCPVRGDIDVFRAEARAPIVAITGSNGKSTVTSLLAAMAEAVGIKVAVGGNLGTPALELLDPAVELYILELSSFQLERCGELAATVATILNISPDHLDRHADLDSYCRAKQQVFKGATHIVSNRADPRTWPSAETARQSSFGLDVPDAPNAWGLQGGQLACGEERVLAASDVPLVGTHNLANALAALALGDALGWPRHDMLSALRGFSGLPHRCQYVAHLDGVDYYNDSKGTNVGATEAAITGLCESGPRKVVLIAGGDGKGADFHPLADKLQRHGRAAVLIGKDAPRLMAVLGDTVPVALADSMAEAVVRARSLAMPGDAVLLSPACASLDMFTDYRQRGEEFVAAVRQLVPGSVP